METMNLDCSKNVISDTFMECLGQIFYECDTEIDLDNCDIIIKELVNFYKMKEIHDYKNNIMEYIKTCALQTDECNIFSYIDLINNLHFLCNEEITREEIENFKTTLFEKINISDKQNKII